MSSENTSFWDNLEALRRSILRTIFVVLLFFAATFILLPHIFDSVVLAPATADFFLYRFIGIDPAPVKIININVATQFLTHISTAFWMAFIAAFPYLIIELWRFIRPALYPGERRSVGAAFTLGTIMFYLGCTLGYSIVFPLTFSFLTNYTLSAAVAQSVSLDSYMSTFLTLIFTMGLLFELPLLVQLLSRIGIVSRAQLKKYRRHAFVALLVIAAIITPSGDPFTLMVVTLPLYSLYEFGILIAKDNTDNE